jgi:hypothetical protein
MIQMYRMMLRRRIDFSHLKIINNIRLYSLTLHEIYHVIAIYFCNISIFQALFVAYFLLHYLLIQGF